MFLLHLEDSADNIRPCSRGFAPGGRKRFLRPNRWFTPWDSPFPCIFHSGMLGKPCQPIGLTLFFRICNLPPGRRRDNGIINRLFSPWDSPFSVKLFVIRCRRSAIRVLLPVPPAHTVDRTGASLTPPGGYAPCGFRCVRRRPYWGMRSIQEHRSDESAFSAGHAYWIVKRVLCQMSGCFGEVRFDLLIELDGG